MDNTRYLLILAGSLLAVVLSAGSLFLAFGNQRVFYYHQGSLVGNCWKAGWVLQLAAIADLGVRTLRGQEVPTMELLLNCIPTLLLMFAQILGNKYHKTVSAKRRRGVGTRA